MADTQVHEYMNEHCVLIWLDPNMDSTDEQIQNIRIINDVCTFTDHDECMDCLTEMTARKVFLILSGGVTEHIVPLVHDMNQLDSIYIYNSALIRNDWNNNWYKIKGLYTDFTSLTEALKVNKERLDHDNTRISTADEDLFRPSLDHLEPSFMYSQLLKEILLEMNHDEQHIKQFTEFWRSEYANSTFKLEHIAQFEREYRPESAIYWYTREHMFYELLSRSLQALDVSTIMKMSFFLCDLYRQIEILHQKQINQYQRKTIALYRGQGLSMVDFQKLQKNKGGLLSFNSFLTTHKHREVSLLFAESAMESTNTVAVLFHISIDTATATIPFASIREFSCFAEEEEVLFSMHTVFRIGTVLKIDPDQQLYQVDLTLTSDDDQELRRMTNYFRAQLKGPTLECRLGNLLIKMGKIQEAKVIYNELLKKKFDYQTSTQIFNHLGIVEQKLGVFGTAIYFFQKAIEIHWRTMSKNRLALADFYKNIGVVYYGMSYYGKAQEYYEKSLQIKEKVLPRNHPGLATSFCHIGDIYYKTGDYSKALEYYNKMLKIREKTLFGNHPDLATSYNNIGLVYQNMGNNSKALGFHYRALAIREKVLLPSDPELAASYNNIGLVFHDMSNYSKALEFHEKALQIRERALPPNHPDLATSYNSIGMLYGAKNDYQNALLFLEKALVIWQKVIPSTNPIIEKIKNNIESVKNKM